MTASERAAEINARYHTDGSYLLVEDAAHWDRYDIHTGDELDHYLAVECYINLYKDRHSIKPRWMDFSKMTTAAVEAMIETDFPSLPPPPVPDDKPLVHNPFAGIRLEK